MSLCLFIAYNLRTVDLIFMQFSLLHRYDIWSSFSIYLIKIKHTVVPKSYQYLPAQVIQLIQLEFSTYFTHFIEFLMTTWSLSVTK